MLTNRIIGAFTFRKGVYAEVEEDTSFTTTAWILVAVVAFLNRLGSLASSDLISWLIGAIGGTILAILGFAVGVLVINWVGRTLLKAEVSFDELVRTLGLAYVWQLIGILGILAVFSEALSCVLAPVQIIAGILMIIAWFLAAKEALDLEWVQTIVTVILGWLAQFVITTVITGLVLGLLGLGSSGMAQAPSTTSTQHSVMYNFASAQAAGTMVHIETESGQGILTFVPTKQYQSVLLSSPELENGLTYVLDSGGSSSGTITDGLYSGGTYTGGTQVASFTITSMVTGAGSAAGGFRGGPGGRPEALSGRAGGL